jgi:ABC-type branched-subunit amino acid transport system substrate-binding protein
MKEEYIKNKYINRQMTMYKIYIIFLCLVVLSGCKDDSTTPGQEKIKISAILDLSGHYSQFGVESKQALELMSGSNKRLEITYYDSQGLSATAVSLLNSIISKNEKTSVVTLASWISNDLADKIAQNNLLQIVIGSAAFDKSVLQSSVKMTQGVESESNYLIDKLKIFNKIAIMYFDNDYGISWNSSLSNSLGSKIVASERYLDTQTDFTIELSRIAQKKPEVIVLISTREAGLIVRQAGSLGITAQFYGTRPILTNELLNEPTAKGLIFSYPKIDYTYSYIKEFQLKYGYKPGSFAAESIDLCNLLDKAANSIKYSRDEVFQFVKNSTLKGAFNLITFDKLCQANYEFTLMKVNNGSFEEM